jgi:hypothetical protein
MRESAVRFGRLVQVAVIGTGVLAIYRTVVAGGLTLDVGIGRRERPLGPIVREIGAPREVVFDVVAAPYLGKTPRAMRETLEVIERGSDMVVAAHHTDIGRGRRATTLETVRFARPTSVHFRLLRGPVPAVVETFDLAMRDDGGTTLSYSGTMSTDWWAIGARWADLVARKWEAAVRSSIESISTEAERRASRPIRRA